MVFTLTSFTGITPMMVIVTFLGCGVLRAMPCLSVPPPSAMTVSSLVYNPKGSISPSSEPEKSVYESETQKLIQQKKYENIIIKTAAAEKARSFFCDFKINNP